MRSGQPGGRARLHAVREVIRTAGRYEILGELGRGAMAVVYRARQIDLDRHVALKELRAFRASDAGLLERFVREAKVAGSLSHPNIVTVHEYFEQEGLPYISMELVACGSLRSHMGQTSTAQLLGVLEGVLAGLGDAAARGLVHRDIKPENLLVGSDGRVKIADFGIARAREELWGAALTEPGFAVGTPAYMAPEQVTAGDVGPWTDLYAVGVVAYEMVTGSLPFAGSASAALARIRSERAPSPLLAAPGLDTGVSEWIEWMLATDPASRPADAATAWDALEQHAIRLFGARWRSQAPLRAAALGTPSRGDTTRGVSVLPVSPDPVRKPAPEPEPELALQPKPEPELGLQPKRGLPPEPEPEPRASSPPPPAAAARHRLARRAPAMLLAAVAVAAAGFGSARALVGEDQGQGAEPRAVASAAFTLRLPAGWQRVDSPPRVPGIRLASALAVAPDQPDGVSLVAGFTDADGPTLLNLDAGELEQPEREADTVALGALQALRYRDLAIAGRPGTRLVLYAIPSDRGVATVACMAPAPAAASALAACERVAATLRLRAARALALGPDPKYARMVTTTLDSLESRRRREGRALARATTARGQARTAARAGLAYARAARSLDAVRTGPAERPAHRRLVAALRGARDALGRLSSAARAGSPESLSQGVVRDGRRTSARRSRDRRPAVARIHRGGEMTRRGRWIAVLAVLFAASFGAGAATSQRSEEPQAGTAARPLGKPASARIDPLSKAPRLPALRRPAKTAAPSANTTPPPPPATPDPSPQTTQPPPPPPPPPGPDPVPPVDPVPE